MMRVHEVADRLVRGEAVHFIDHGDGALFIERRVNDGHAGVPDARDDSEICCALSARIGVDAGGSGQRVPVLKGL